MSAFCLTTLRRVKIYNTHNPSALETPGVWNLSQTLGSSFTYLEPVGQEVSPWKMS